MQLKGLQKWFSCKAGKKHGTGKWCPPSRVWGMKDMTASLSQSLRSHHEYSTNPFMTKQSDGKPKQSWELAPPSAPLPDLPTGSQLNAAEQHPKATQKCKQVKLQQHCDRKDTNGLTSYACGLVRQRAMGPQHPGSVVVRGGPLCVSRGFR